MEHQKTLAKGMLILCVGMVLSRLLSYGYRLIISYSLGIGVFGVFSLALALFSVVSSVITSGMNVAVSRLVAFYRGKNEKEKIRGVIVQSFLLVILASIAGAIIVFLGAETIAERMGYPELKSILKIFALMFPLYSIVMMTQKLFEGLQKIGWSVLIEFAMTTLRVIFGIIVILFGLSIIGVTASYATSVLMTMIFLLIIFWDKILAAIKDLRKVVNRKEMVTMKEIGKDTSTISASNIIHTLLTWGDTILLGIWRTSQEVGLYNIAVPTANLLTLPIFAMNTALLPLMSKLFSERNAKGVESLYKTATKWLLFMLVPLLVVIVVLSEEIMSILVQNTLSSTILIILVCGVFINSLAAPANTLLIAVGKSKFMMMNSLIAAIVNIGLNILLIPRLGIKGAAFAFLASAALITILRIIEVYNLLGLIPFSKKMIRLGIISIITAGIGFFVDKGMKLQSAYMSLLVSVAIIGIIYLALLYVGRCFDQEDKEMIQIIKRKIKGSIR